MLGCVLCRSPQSTAKVLGHLSLKSQARSSHMAAQSHAIIFFPCVPVRPGTKALLKSLLGIDRDFQLRWRALATAQQRHPTRQHTLTQGGNGPGDALLRLGAKQIIRPTPPAQKIRPTLAGSIWLPCAPLLALAGTIGAPTKTTTLSLSMSFATRGLARSICSWVPKTATLLCTPSFLEKWGFQELLSQLTFLFLASWRLHRCLWETQ